MLEALYLTKSRTRQRLFGLLFSQPRKDYYLSELARLTGTSPGNVRRELSRFVQDRLVFRQKRGNLVLYSVNAHHALFPELRSLFLKTSGIEGRLRQFVEEQKGVRLAFLYGSFARDAESGESDVDLLIVADKRLPGFYTALSQLESHFDREVNSTIYSSDEFRRKIAQKDDFVMHLLKEPHRVLKGDLGAYQKRHPRGTSNKP